MTRVEIFHCLVYKSWRNRMKKNKMGAVRLVIGGAILGLFWSSFPQTMASDNIEGICQASSCACDLHGRLTCDCKDALEDVEEVILNVEGKERVTPHTSRIIVRNCPKVIVMNSSLSSMTGLRSIELINITNLILFTRSFELSPKTSRAMISIESSNINILPSFVFKGDMESINFQSVDIHLVSAFAFANLAKTDLLRLKDCNINKFEEQSFKKFDVNHLHIIGGLFGSEQVPSRTINDVEVFKTFRLDGVTMGIIRSSAFVIKNPKTVSIQNSIINTIESESFDITTLGPVLIKNNQFSVLNAGSFLAIKRDIIENKNDDNDDDDNNPNKNNNNVILPDITFTNNTLNYFEEGSVIFDRNSFRPVIDNVYINRTCDCNLLTIWKNNILNYSSIHNRFYSGNTLIQNEYNNILEPIEEGIFLCLDDINNNNINYINFQDFELKYCELNNSKMLYIFIIISLLLILIILIIILIWCCKRHQRNHGQKRWISVPTSAPDVVSKKNGVINNTSSSTPNTPVDSRITMVVPDGRLYRETEFHVIVEKAEPLTTEL